MKGNRFTTTKGSLTVRGSSATDASGKSERGTRGVQLLDDPAGQCIQATLNDGTVETYTYTADGYLEDTTIVVCCARAAG